MKEAICGNSNYHWTIFIVYRLTIDEYGNIYITESYSYQVFIVAEDGARYRKLLQKSDGLFNVNGIFINTKKQQLLLCAKRDKMAVLYDVSIQPRDEDIRKNNPDIIRTVYVNTLPSTHRRLNR